MKGAFDPRPVRGVAEFPYRMQCEDMLSGIFHTQLFFLHTGEKGDISIRGHSYNENLLQDVSGCTEDPIKMGINRCAIFGRDKSCM